MSRSKIRIAVVGASGYGGAESVRLIQSHPCAEVVAATSSRSAGRRLRELCPWLATDLVLQPFEESIDADVFFLCQEAGFASDVAPGLAKKAKVIDFSADFRLKDAAIHEATYKLPWPGDKLDKPAVYGMPELVDRSEIAAAQVVANPGCFPTASLMALMPLIKAGIIAGTPVIDAKSGASGAGRSKTETDYLFSELSGNSKAYKATGHRHVPEIRQLAGMPVRFTPHLLPVARGLEATLHVPITKVDKTSELLEIFETAYKDEPFVYVQNEQPSIKQVLGSNTCAMTAEFDKTTGFAVVTSVIDNLVKGAAGQAIQNMNLMFELPEEAGLPVSGVWP